MDRSAPTRRRLVVAVVTAAVAIVVWRQFAAEALPPATGGDPPELPAALADAALVRRPGGASPARVALLLHGAGSAPEKFLDVADQVVQNGFVALVVRGPIEEGPGRYTWSSPDETDALLRRVVELAGREMVLAPGRPILVGYSLGGTMAVELLARHPDGYASAFAISPGVLNRNPLLAAPGVRPLTILVGSNDAASERAVDAIERLWDDAHEPVWVVHHAGDHRPPEDWRARFDDAMTWMSVKASS